MLCAVTSSLKLEQMSSFWRSDLPKTMGYEKWYSWTSVKDTCTDRRKKKKTWNRRSKKKRARHPRDYSGTLENVIYIVGRATSCVFYHSWFRVGMTWLFAWKIDAKYVERISELLEWKIARDLLFWSEVEDDDADDNELRWLDLFTYRSVVTSAKFEKTTRSDIRHSIAEFWLEIDRSILWSLCRMKTLMRRLKV